VVLTGETGQGKGYDEHTLSGEHTGEHRANDGHTLKVRQVEVAKVVVLMLETNEMERVVLTGELGKAREHRNMTSTNSLRYGVDGGELGKAREATEMNIGT
jgi:hypothetical protein